MGGVVFFMYLPQLYKSMLCLDLQKFAVLSNQGIASGNKTGFQLQLP